MTGGFLGRAIPVFRLGVAPSTVTASLPPWRARGSPRIFVQARR